MEKRVVRKIGSRGRLAAFLMLALFAYAANSCKLAVNEPLMEMEPLSYAQDALEPYMSAETLGVHYGKHYAGYVEAANRRVKQSRFRRMAPIEIMRQTYGDQAHAAVFNNVCQAWNHAFFFKAMQPDGGGKPEGRLYEQIVHDFGSLDKFKAEFMAAAGDRFGSGWVWLVVDRDSLKIMSTANADTPVAHGLKPLFVVDVWEHAYYLDYRNRRGDFVKAILEHLANWDFAASELERHLPAATNSKPG